MLEVKDLTAGYGAAKVLDGLNFSALAGQITCVMGRNGVGKTTLMKAIIGAVRASSGRIELDGVELSRLPAHLVPSKGVAWVPQGRRLFGEMSVAENLAVGGLVKRGNPAQLQRVLALFPRLGERMNQQAGTLSGGEQQMLAIGRALCLEPKLLLLDEPTEGLQPSIVSLIREAILTLRESGVAVVLVEQKVEAVLALADRVAFMQHGRVAALRDAKALTPHAPEFREYVGV